MKPYREAILEVVPPQGGQLSGVRRRAYERFKAVGFPQRNWEDWKYVNLEPILGGVFEKPRPVLDAALRKPLERFLDSRQAQRHELLFVNGVYSEEFSAHDWPSGVTVQNLKAAFSPHEALIQASLAAHLEEEPNAFCAINTFSFPDGAFVRVPAEAELKKPIRILFVTVGKNSEAPVFYPRVLALLGEGARASLTVMHVGLSGDRSLTDAVLEARLAQGASLNYLEVRRPQGYFLSSSRFYLESESDLHGIFFTQGAAITRGEAAVFFEGERAKAALRGFSMARGTSQIFNYAAAYHKLPHCTSDQFFKSIVADRAKSEFTSLVSVKRGAKKSHSNQLGRNLLLSDLAQAFTRPQLRIDDDDVSCVHGATVGQLETDELFYLRSRGLSREAARYLLIEGFAGEILEAIGDSGARQELWEFVRHELGTIAGG